MTRMFVRHKINDYAAWRQVYDDFPRESLGATAHAVYQNPDDPNDIIVERLTLNAASATTKGVELELMALPVAGLQLDGSLGYLDARYDSFDDAISELSDEEIDRSGETFNGVPKLQAHVGVQYSHPVRPPGPEWLDGWLTPRLDWSYQSALHYAGPEVGAAKQSGFNLLHARLSYDFGSDAAQVALWVKNLTDKTYAGDAFSIANLFGTVIRYYDPPRTFGVELSYRF